MAAFIKGTRVEFIQDGPVPWETRGEVYEIPIGFGIRYDDDTDVRYSDADAGLFRVLFLPVPPKSLDEEVALTLLSQRLNRPLVDAILARYREDLAADLDEIRSDPATSEKYHPGLRMAAGRLVKAEDR